MGGHAPEPGIEMRNHIYSGRCQFCKSAITSVYPPHWECRTYRNTNPEIGQ